MDAKWPVAILKDANLDLICIEMLNIGTEYVWLDVLCLRQVDRQREDLRLEEWKVNVPTIGCCISEDPGGVLLQRLVSDVPWTLQEMSKDPIFGGDTGDNKIMEDKIRKIPSIKTFISFAAFRTVRGVPGYFWSAGGDAGSCIEKSCG
ncbi:uncharacterized protein ARMOST_11395 [Armillaria ostoyae]|uniref:Heterokaryon incompatibility domain-containing protein n=1 Tax=Armillaria ostoyae TaxID=47428 RepID=A0A284RH13_ARMOS|nr:uncharacterized protein ARMOST_11395 [Armillaria ostoyae]